MDVTVFYAWQDDRPGKCNRRLIHDAAEAACKRITDDPANDFEVRLDQDTAGRPGMCDIPNTILEKIRDCDVLLADLTFVGTTDPEVTPRKQIPNPNVLMELGYAVGCKATDESDGFDRVIGVMNVTYGKPEEQMFDIKRRRPISYELPEGSDKEQVQRARKSLSKDTENALRTILNEAVLPAEGEAGAKRFQDIRDQFEESVKDGSFFGIFRKDGALAISLIPHRLQPFDHSAIQMVPMVPPGFRSGTPMIKGKYVLCVAEADIPTGVSRAVTAREKGRCAISAVAQDGFVVGVNTSILMKRVEQGGSWFEGTAFHREKKSFSSKAFEEAVVRAVANYSAVLRNLNASPPLTLGISLLGVRGYYMLADDRRIGNALDHADEVVAENVTIQEFSDITTYEPTSNVLRKTFDYIYREFGCSGSPYYDISGKWQGPWTLQ